MTPEQRALRGRLGAAVLHSRIDPRLATENARRAFLDRFEREVDPDGRLPIAERRRRAAQARKAYFYRLALASAKARSARKTRRERRDQRARSGRPKLDT
jgi:hypothetical protein